MPATIPGTPRSTVLLMTILVCGGIFMGDKPAIDSRKIKRASHFSGVI